MLACMSKSASKQRLSRELIVEAGLALADEQGMNAVSTRKIASRLGVTSMAIYRYFDDMQDLQSEMLDRFVHQASVLPSKDLPWDEWLMHVSQRMFTAFCEAPAWIALLGRIRLKRGTLEVMDRGLAVLTQAGFSNRQAVQIFFVMNQAVIGAASLQHSLNSENRRQSIPLEQFAPDEFPDVNNCLPEMLGVIRSDMLEANMKWLISALRAELAG